MTLDPDYIEAIVDRLAEKLADREPVVVRYVDVATAARRLSMSPDWVRQHATELGGAKMGDGKRGVLRFDIRMLDRFVAARRLEQDPPRQRRKPGPRTGVRSFEVLKSRRRRPGPRRIPDGVELLPLP